jgi:hypothetical protein
MWSFKRNKSATDYKALMENDPGISGVVFLSASAAKDKDKHFSLDELQQSRPRACTAAGPTQSGDFGT